MYIVKPDLDDQAVQQEIEKVGQLTSAERECNDLNSVILFSVGGRLPPSPWKRTGGQTPNTPKKRPTEPRSPDPRSQSPPRAAAAEPVEPGLAAAPAHPGEP